MKHVGGTCLLALQLIITPSVSHRSSLVLRWLKDATTDKDFYIELQNLPKIE